MATYWENSCSFGLRYVSWYKYLIVSLVFSRLGFWGGNLFLIAPFPDLCLLVPLNTTFIFTCSCYGIGQRVRVTYCNILRVQVMSKTWAASEKKCLKTCFF